MTMTAEQPGHGIRNPADRAVVAVNLGRRRAAECARDRRPQPRTQEVQRGAERDDPAPIGNVNDGGAAGAGRHAINPGQADVIEIGVGEYCAAALRISMNLHQKR
jgi:hypothetical protein